MKFGLSIEQIGYGVTYSEAVLLVSMLLRDPTSWLQAKVNEWKHPVSMEWMLNANIFDVTLASNSKGKVQPMERPWPSTHANRIGGRTKLPQNKIREILDNLRTKEENTDG